MSYDPVKAHEYYERYRKKGILKGRKRKSAEEKALREQKALETKNAAKAIRDKIKAERKKEYDHLRNALKLYLKKMRDTWRQQGLPIESQKAKIEEIRSRTKETRKRIRDKYAEKLKQELGKIK